MPKPGPISNIESDPEFAKFPPDVQRRILADAQAAPTRPTPQPAPAPTPAKPSRPPLMSLAAMDPKPAGPSIADLANDKRRRLIPADLPQRASVMDEARAVMPEFPGERPADVAARNRRLAIPPIPGTKESAARATREVVTENLLGGVSGGMMLAPNYQQDLQRAAPPMRQPIPARPPLVTPQAADLTTRERAGAMARQGGALLKGMYDAIEGPIEDVVRDPSRLHPMSEGFLEGAVATPLGTAALAVDPAAGYGFGLAGLGAKTLGKGAVGAIKAVPSVAKVAAGPVARVAATPAGQEWIAAAASAASDAMPRAEGRVGSIRIGRPDGSKFNDAAKKVDQSLTKSIRELRAQQEAAQANGDGARVAELEDFIRPLDDARATVPHRYDGPVIRVAQLANDLTDAAIANDVPRQVRIARQIQQMSPKLYYNESKLGLSPESTAKYESALQTAIEELRGRGEDPRKRQRTADRLAVAADIPPWVTEERARKGLKKGESLTDVEYMAAVRRLKALSDESVVTEQRLNELSGRRAAGDASVTEDMIRAVQQEMGTQEHDMVRLHEITTGTRSQKGRDLAFLKAQVAGGWDVGYWTSRAARTSGGPLSSGNIVRITRLVSDGEGYDQALKAALAAGDPAAEAAARAGIRQARIDLALEMGKLAETDPRDYLVGLGKAMPLTGLATAGRNMGSNLINIGMEGASRPMSSLADMVLSMASGRRTVATGSPASMRRGFHNVAETGMREAWETMRYGTTLDQAAAMEVPNELNIQLPVSGPINDILNLAPNLVFRSMSAQDRLFKAYSMRRSLDDQAWLIARNELGRGNTPAHRALATRLADNPTPEMQREALAHSEFMTFQNDTFVSKGIAGAKRLAMESDRGFNERIQQAASAVAPGHDVSTNFTPGRDAVRAFDSLIKYTKTPASIAARVVDLAIVPLMTGIPITGSGAAAAGMVVSRRVRAALRREITEAINPAEQKMIAEGIGRGFTGSALLYLGGRLYQEGLLTGSMQADRIEEDATAGRSPGALLVGGQRIPLNWASPLGNILVMGATLMREGDDAGQAAMLSWQTLLDQPLMSGAKDLVGSLKPGEEGMGPTANRIAGGLASAYVPNIVKEIAQATDDSGSDRLVDSSEFWPAIRTSVGKKIPSGPGIDQMMNFLGVPTREQLPIKVTGLGDEVDMPSGLLAFSAGAGKFARDRVDPIVRAVISNPETRVPPMPKKVPLGTMARDVPITQAEGAELYRRQGQMAREALEDFIYDPSWEQETDEYKTGVINGIIGETYAAARDEWVEEHRAELETRGASVDDSVSRALDRRRAPLPEMRPL